MTPASGKWVETPLADGKYASPVVVIELASGASYFLALPRTFVLHENDTKEYLPEMDGTLYVTKTPDGFHLTVNGYGLAEGRVTDCLILSAPFQLVDWSMQNCAMAWVTYVQNGASHWCFDGYYRKSPANYIPSGTNYYYCCAASYCIKGFLSRMPMCKEAAALTIVTLDTMAQRQNEYGYWPPSPAANGCRATTASARASTTPGSIPTCWRSTSRPRASSARACSTRRSPGTSASSARSRTPATSPRSRAAG